ncbi:hypothetical protein G7046_g1335 [Stylonectria norvegica]|nr:hypothetical protein G7046_g1335 [Stylonectria norvegica]
MLRPPAILQYETPTCYVVPRMISRRTPHIAFDMAVRRYHHRSTTVDKDGKAACRRSGALHREIGFYTVFYGCDTYGRCLRRGRCHRFHLRLVHLLRDNDTSCVMNAPHDNTNPSLFLATQPPSFASPPTVPFPRAMLSSPTRSAPLCNVTRHRRHPPLVRPTIDAREPWGGGMGSCAAVANAAARPMYRYREPLKSWEVCVPHPA